MLRKLFGCLRPKVENAAPLQQQQPGDPPTNTEGQGSPELPAGTGSTAAGNTGDSSSPAAAGGPAQPGCGGGSTATGSKSPAYAQLDHLCDSILQVLKHKDPNEQYTELVGLDVLEQCTKVWGCPIKTAKAVVHKRLWWTLPMMMHHVRLCTASVSWSHPGSHHRKYVHTQHSAKSHHSLPLPPVTRRCLMPSTSRTSPAMPARRVGRQETQSSRGMAS
jgi:hypothetical protein